ncbi:MerR family transcriptional regulator [Nocardioides caldifontis]|uniref:MerR family transcriptional regulator n=1 Tax=Nocardioides caldifontis TaxID=2588938 RepID=UPI0013968866|nr:MerR family transcriptional regulator [Nocardioides caldifontis]
MRLSELEQTSGVPAATIKYYLREGLLHPGRAVSARLAEYDESHVRRLRLLRVLREVGDVPVSRLQLLVRAVEDERPVQALLGVTADALAPAPPPDDGDRGPSRELAVRVLAGLGWVLRPDTPDLENLAATLESYERLNGRPLAPEVITEYGEVADRLARHEIAALDPTAGRAELLTQMVVGQVLFGHLLTVLRRLAEEHHSGERFGRPEEQTP